MHTAAGESILYDAVPMKVMTTQRLYNNLTVVTLWYLGHGHQHGYHQAKFEWT